MQGQSSALSAGQTGVPHSKQFALIYLGLAVHPFSALPVPEMVLPGVLYEAVTL